MCELWMLFLIFPFHFLARLITEFSVKSEILRTWCVCNLSFELPYFVAINWLIDCLCLQTGKMARYFGDLELFAILVACLTHNIGYRGVTYSMLVRSVCQSVLCDLCLWLLADFRLFSGASREYCENVRLFYWRWQFTAWSNNEERLSYAPPVLQHLDKNI